MFTILKSDSVWRKSAAGFVAIAMLTACGSGGESTDNQSTASAVKSDSMVVAGDHVLGDPNAPVTVVEYASVTCGACGNWHTNVYPEFKEKYIDTGKVKFVFREFEINPSLDFAGFTIANCAGEEKFFNNISVQFKRQRAILGAQDKRKAYEELAKSSGISVKQYESCMADKDWRAKYEEIQRKGIEMGVNSTPTFFVDGVRHPGKKLFTIEQFDALLEPILNPAEPVE